MPSNREMTAEEEDKFEEGGGLKKRTKDDRLRDCNAFYTYFESKVDDGVNMKDCLQDEDGREKFSKIFSNYFWSMTVESGDRPKKNYASKLKTAIKMQMIDDFKVDITDQNLFPNFSRRWKSFVDKLAEEGRADTKHKEEIPATTLEKIYELLWAVKQALENRGAEDYVETYLSKIPAMYHDQLHRILQWGAALVLVFYEVRRGKENLDDLKASSMKVFEDNNFVFKYLRKVISETDKNHPGGTNVRCNGVIPFLEVDGGWNPGAFFEFYLKFLPMEASKQALKGGWLFPRPRRHSVLSLDIHREGEMALFEPNMKGNIENKDEEKTKLVKFINLNLISVGPRTLGEMLPALCQAVGEARCTNHQLRYGIRFLSI